MGLEPVPADAAAAAAAEEQPGGDMVITSHRSLFTEFTGFTFHFTVVRDR